MEKKIKRINIFFTTLILSMLVSGCAGSTSVENVSNDKNVSSSMQKKAQGDGEGAAFESESTGNPYDTDLKVFVVDGKYMEAQWTFRDDVVFDTTVLSLEQQGDIYNPQVTLTFSGGKEKDAVDNFALEQCYYNDPNNKNLCPDLTQFFESAQNVANSRESAECEISKEIQGNTLILRIKAPESSNFDFTTFKWFETKIRFAYDEASAIYKEYSDTEVVSDYSLNSFPNPEYVKAKPENTQKEVSFDGQSFTADSEYYTIFKFEVPKLFVFDDGWYYSEVDDLWFFTSRGERYSSITEYEITSYDSEGNVISHETRTIFPSQEDLLSSYRGDKGASEGEKNLTLATADSRLKYLYDFYASSCPNIYAEGNILYNGAFFESNVQFSESNDFSVFKPDSSGYAYDSVSYNFQVEGGFSAADYQMNVTAYYSDASLYQKIYN